MRHAERFCGKVLSHCYAQSLLPRFVHLNIYAVNPSSLPLPRPAAKKKLGVDETVALEAEVDALLTSEVLQVKKVRMG